MKQHPPVAGYVIDEGNCRLTGENIAIIRVDTKYLNSIKFSGIRNNGVI